MPHYDLDVFGARSGDLLRGYSVSKGITIRTLTDIPPVTSAVNDFITDYGTDKLVNMAAAIPFFRRMSRDDRLEWIKSNSVEMQSIEDITPSPLIEIIDISDNDKLLPFIESSESSTATIEEIQNSLDVRTLVFFNQFWRISFEDYEFKRSEAKHDTRVIYNGKWVNLCEIPNDAKIYKFNIDDIIIATDPPDIIQRIDPTWLCDTTYFTAASYKSLIQKTIRYSPLRIELSNGETIDSTKFVEEVFSVLFNHPGSFVPDLRRFVRGNESAMKRLAITIVEDSYIEDADIIVVDLLAHTLLAQKIPGWRPSRRKYELWKSIAGRAINEQKVFIYDRPTDLANNRQHVSTSGFALASYLLDMIGSFPTDITMISSIHKNNGRTSTMKCISRPLTMPIHHCIDQHWSPGFIYLFPIEYVRNNSLNNDKPYANIFDDVWFNVSALNPRKEKLCQSEIRSMIESAQEIYHRFRLGLLKDNHRELIGTRNLKLEYPESWIASRVGPIMLSKPHAMVTINPENIDILVATRKPSRNSRDRKLSAKDEENAIEAARVRLRSGIHGVKLVRSQHNIQEGINETYEIDGKSLCDFMNQEITLNVFKNNNQSISLPMRPEQDHSMDIMENDIDMIENIMNVCTISEINRAIYYIKMSSDVIRFANVSRSGGGTKSIITKDEVISYQIISYIGTIYPFALQVRQKDIAVFDVKYPLFIRRIGDFLSLRINSKSVNVTCFSNIGDKRGLVPFNHQIDAVNEMITRTMRGNNGNFIWIPVGMGKTYIVCSYLAYLISNNMCPKFVVYTLPKSATASVKLEIESWNFKVNTIVPLKNKKWNLDCKMVNMIEHDHLRLIQNDLLSIAPESIFIVDEVHKTLASTQRTGAALNVASLSKLFVALTGTPTINSDMSLLINWLKLVVDYPIDTRTFWIAINSMVSKVVNTGVIVDTRSINAEFNDEEREIYYKLVGRKLGGTNDRATNADLLRAIEVCYEACDRIMIDLTLEWMDDGVFLVSRNTDHQLKLKKELEVRGVSNIGLVDKDTTWYLEKPTDPGPNIIITTVRKSEGYTLTKLGTMITSVYFSNLATRQQLQGRINRVSQIRNLVREFTVYAGLLEFVMAKYDNVRNINMIMEELVC